MHKLTKFSINAVIQGIKGLQFFCFLFALLTLTYFILTLVHIQLPEQVQMIFNIFYNVQSLIYKPNLSFIPVDFTFAIVGIEFLIIAYLLFYAITFVIDIEIMYDKIHENSRKKYEANFNRQLERKANKVANSNKEFVILCGINIEKVFDNFHFEEDKNVNAEEKILEYRTSLNNFLSQSFKFTTQNTNSGKIYYFDDVKICNELFDKIFEFIKTSKETLKQNRLKFTLKCAVCCASKKTSVTEFLPKLNKLLEIAQPNKITSLADFKFVYDKLKEQKYTPSGIGSYSICDDVEELYIFEK